MNKDVIYIDVEDDITAIIGKVKESKEKVVALVPPKRTGVLQSAVNLRLLQRTAKNDKKHLVLITNDQSLIPLAAGASIPIAKNLQSKPEMPEIAALKVDDDDDIIDGSQLPVGDHAASVAPVAKKPATRISIDEAVAAAEPVRATPPARNESPRKPKGATKVPNFNAFRKKLIIIILLVLGLIGFLIWAIWFAPRATVEITAKTSDARVATSVQLGVQQQTDASKGTLRAVQMEESQQTSVDFEATGSEEQGEKASGVVTLYNCASRRSVEIPVGTAISYGNYNFITSRAVEVPGGSSSSDFGGCDTPGTVRVSVTAQNIGDEYNIKAKTSFDVAGQGGVSAVNAEAFTGGSKKILKIVTQGDVQRASEKIAQQNDNAIKTKLRQKFGSDIKVIDASFRMAKSDVAAVPEVGKEAPDGKAKLTATVVYVMNGVANADLETFIKGAAEAKLSKEDNQRVHDAGTASAQLTEFAATDTGGTANLSATTQVGPQIEDSDVKTRVKGKKFGDIQSDLKSIQGVDDVDVKLSPFWVSTVPNDTERITVKFKLINTAKNGS